MSDFHPDRGFSFDPETTSLSSPLSGRHSDVQKKPKGSYLFQLTSTYRWVGVVSVWEVPGSRYPFTIFLFLYEHGKTKVTVSVNRFKQTSSLLGLPLLNEHFTNLNRIRIKRRFTVEIVRLIPGKICLRGRGTRRDSCLKKKKERRKTVVQKRREFNEISFS